MSAVLGHLFIHQIHHRGQVHAMLAGTSAKPPQLDEFFLDQDEPLRREELRALALPPLQAPRSLS
ncbi:MAG TPA: DinB family protein [Dongiaceae bacterium]|nr:DinB family protein [Dongiaceae bacterium]